jgi:prophage tail gpP-like protein
MTMLVEVSAPSRELDELALSIGGEKLSGWTEIAVTLRAEGFPSSFEVALSSRGPGGKGVSIAPAGADCEVFLGDDLVVTGYVDRVIESGDGESHRISVIGRGRTQDLVDCSAEWPTAQLVQGTALDIATRLASAYGIPVVLGEGAEAGDPVPAPWCLNYTDTGASIIQRVAQAVGLLAYENAAGALVLANAGNSEAASGIVYGENVEGWSVELAADQRFSEIVCRAISQDAWGDLPGSDIFDTEVDPNVARHRRLNIVMADVAEDPRSFTIRKAIWEVARRAGRATSARATIDSWRDAAGALWRPNTMVPVSLPGMPADMMLCLSEVTFRRDEGGTHADLALLPREAFILEPTSLLPLAAADVLGPDATP